MGVVSKIKEFFGLGGEAEVYEEIIDEAEEYEEEEAYVKPRKNRQMNNVVSLHAVKEQAPRVMLVEPKSYEEVQEIADHLCSRRAVVINLQRVPGEQAKRIIDFLSGTVYAINGSIQRVGHKTFLCLPEHMEVQGNITEMIYDDRG
ncbi:MULTISPECIES: cell division protein SepF [Aneurinibacillus]|uniref:Cell division protein SepF n=1 Tax=Aneurinibacillus thermoaerophilus TaxID=143495 RepID=A0A1G7W998_ANETH|nr:MULTISPECIES: cell division protein SepF [Aneurinibacillus]AMA72586.1 cell division protein SepF [Aneurinibacillus sp. XH2]MED0674706.1 cell division protein SepF [Aneurinibacillus thermoaerophilus]MED0680189.1 cell division protein SepF [Aneurinibacillus thermoaerophilus]MED0736862.1 cell division protein SepF [Aneurinibacillus thermoaerophilus]MED0756703.1 cell division protein SepF [Aneurinibacillus thermoaerophilus]